jgi:hypothetical protein
VQTERSWLVPTLLVVLVAVSLGVAGLLLGKSGATDLIDKVRGAVGQSDKTAEVNIARAEAFDPPPGDGKESSSAVPLAIDGNPDTRWTTEGYTTRMLGGLKPGVGYVVVLAAPATLDRVEVTSGTSSWRAAVYVGDAPASDLAGWGEPVFVTKPIAAGTHSIDLKGRQGSAVLIWIIDLGDGPAPFRTELAEVHVFARSG